MKIAITSLLLVGLLMAGSYSCVKEKEKDNCKPGYGWLKMTNGSLTTIQKVMIDGTNYGTLDPGETATYQLAAGKHTFESIGISGGGGCSQASAIIVECATEARVCKY